MSNSDFYNHQVTELVKKYPQLFFEMPMIYKDLNNVEILFVGINPSRLTNEKVFSFLVKNISKHKDLENLIELTSEEHIFKLFSLDSINKEEKIQQLANLNELFFREYAYFKKFIDINKYIESSSFGHLDLLPIRETDQSKIKQLMENNPFFLNDAIQLFIQTIERINPKIIVVENSLARDLLINNEISKKHFPEYSFKISEYSKFGTPINHFGQGIIYTSMLTGQRAMDKGSYHRMIHTINQILTSIK
jgi:hypothetical protein